MPIAKRDLKRCPYCNTRKRWNWRQYAQHNSACKERLARKNGADVAARPPHPEGGAS